MASRRKRASTGTGAGDRERVQRRDPAPYALSCALYAIARDHMDRCDVWALISRIMACDTDIYIVSELVISLRAVGVSDDVITRLWRRYMM